jgi:hypothetical protein
MTTNARRITGFALMAMGPALVLVSPWLVLSFGPIRERVGGEAWALGITGCLWESEVHEAAVFGWFGGFVAMGVGALFLGLWLFRSAGFRQRSFGNDALAV